MLGKHLEQRCFFYAKKNSSFILQLFIGVRVLMKNIFSNLFLLIILFFLNCLSAHGQANDKWRAGSAYSLSGKIYVLTVFISETEWKYEEKVKLYDDIFEAQDWLVKQAKKYGKSINFSGGNYGMDKTIRIDNIPVGTGSGTEPTDLITRVLKKIGYSSPIQFSDWLKKNTDCTNSLVFVIANKQGRGYAMPYSKGMSYDKYFLEGCILYKEFSTDFPLNSASIAHEFLHLFGAWDLYETFSQTKEHEEKAREIFPDDIMLRNVYDINELKIDKLTAWLIGLSAFSEKWYEWFRPNDY